MNFNNNAPAYSGFDPSAINASLANISMASTPLTPPSASAAYDVTNSGLYHLFINEAWLGTRMVAGAPHDVIFVRGLATHTAQPEHSGNLFFSVPLVQDPAGAYPSDIELMRSFLCLTGCTVQGPNGPVMNIATTVEQTKNGTSRACIPAVKGVRIIVAIKGNVYKDKRYLNPVGFLADDFRSWDEVCRNLPPEQHKTAFGHLIAEGLPLRPVERRQDSHDAPAYGGPAAAQSAAPSGEQNPYGAWQQPAAAPSVEPNPYGAWQQPAAAAAAAPAYAAPGQNPYTN